MSDVMTIDAPATDFNATFNANGKTIPIRGKTAEEIIMVAREYSLGAGSR